MALWKEPATAAKDLESNRDTSGRDFFAKEPPPASDKFVEKTLLEKTSVTPPVSTAAPRATTKPDAKESVIASDLTIEGKIEGSGHVRIAGRFKGDVHVEGNLTIESGARLTGEVRASTVVVGGELEGNIEAATRVELLQTGVLNGDLKAGSLTVAAGSRMRGRAEFGWGDNALNSEGAKTTGIGNK
jgi:cytoskeletal protein CcmA (bactofilin family)